MSSTYRWLHRFSPESNARRHRARNDSVCPCTSCAAAASRAASTSEIPSGCKIRIAVTASAANSLVNKPRNPEACAPRIFPANFCAFGRSGKNFLTLRPVALIPGGIDTIHPSLVSTGSKSGLLAIAPAHCHNCHYE